MTTTHTLNVHFWLKRSSIKKAGTTPIYARIWIDSIPIDISTKVAVLEKHWCNKANRAKTRTKDSKSINDLLDGIIINIKNAYQQLRDEGRPITTQSLKSRYLGKDKAVLTCRDLMDYHTENELEKLAPGTAKNYSSTEKYICRFIKKEFKSYDVYLAQIDYSFIVKFEGYLRNTTPLKKSQPLNHNGIMKHMERLQKFTTLALKHGWIKTNPFALYQLKFQEFDCAFLEQGELDIIATLSIEKPSLSLVRDVFIFSCYTGLSYIDIKNLKRPDIVTGIDGEQWIMVRRQKTRTPVKLPLLDEANDILDNYSDYPTIENNYSLLQLYMDLMSAVKAFLSFQTTYLQALRIWCTTQTCVLDPGKTERMVSVKPLRLSVAVIRISCVPRTLMSVSTPIQKEEDSFLPSQSPNISFLPSLRRPTAM